MAGEVFLEPLEDAIAGEALVGIVSIGDIVKGQLEELELEVGVLRDFARVRL